MSFINVLESPKYIGFIAITKAPSKEIFWLEFNSLRSPYVAITPINPKVKVEKRSAVNEKPKGKQNSAPQRT
jgi:hypothetical protein